MPELAGAAPAGPGIGHEGTAFLPFRSPATAAADIRPALRRGAVGPFRTLVARLTDRLRWYAPARGRRVSLATP